MSACEDVPRIRVTIGIPLYAAAPWVERIVANIEALAAPGVEFVLSDRHGLDDAAEQVRARCAAIAQLRIDACRDGRGWIDNYNHLLHAARGDYFRILTQDDALPRASLDAAVAALDADPGTVLVAGPADLIDVDGRVILADPRLPAYSPPASRLAQALDALRLFSGARYVNVNLALVRRQVAAAHALSIPPTAGASGLSVRAWLFALALRGRARYVPDYVSVRCIHAGSYTARHWRRPAIAQLQRACSYLRAGTAAWCGAHRGIGARAAGVAALAYGALVAMPLRQAIARFTPAFRKVSATQQAR